MRDKRGERGEWVWVWVREMQCEGILITCDNYQLWTEFLGSFSSAILRKTCNNQWSINSAAFSARFLTAPSCFGVDRTHPSQTSSENRFTESRYWISLQYLHIFWASTQPHICSFVFFMARSRKILDIYTHTGFNTRKSYFRGILFGQSAMLQKANRNLSFQLACIAMMLPLQEGETQPFPSNDNMMLRTNFSIDHHPRVGWEEPLLNWKIGLVFDLIFMSLNNIDLILSWLEGLVWNKLLTISFSLYVWMAPRGYSPAEDGSMLPLQALCSKMPSRYHVLMILLFQKKTKSLSVISDKHGIKS